MSKKSGKSKFRINDYVLLTDGRIGQVMYEGPLSGKSGEFIGLSLRNAAGKHDGSYKGKRVFRAKAGTGVFVRRKNIEKHVSSSENWRDLLTDDNPLQPAEPVSNRTETKKPTAQENRSASKKRKKKYIPNAQPKFDKPKPTPGSPKKSNRRSTPSGRGSTRGGPKKEEKKKAVKKIDYHTLGGAKLKRLPRQHAIQKSKRILAGYFEHWKEVAESELYNKTQLRELFREEIGIDQNITDKLYKILTWHDLDGGVRLKEMESVLDSVLTKHPHSNIIELVDTTISICEEESTLYVRSIESMKVYNDQYFTKQIGSIPKGTLCSVSNVTPDAIEITSPKLEINKGWAEYLAGIDDLLCFREVPPPEPKKADPSLEVEHSSRARSRTPNRRRNDVKVNAEALKPDLHRMKSDPASPKITGMIPPRRTRGGKRNVNSVVQPFNWAEMRKKQLDKKAAAEETPGRRRHQNLESPEPRKTRAYSEADAYDQVDEEEKEEVIRDLKEQLARVKRQLEDSRDSKIALITQSAFEIERLKQTLRKQTQLISEQTAAQTLQKGISKLFWG